MWSSSIAPSNVEKWVHIPIAFAVSQTRLRSHGVEFHSCMIVRSPSPIMSTLMTAFRRASVPSSLQRFARCRLPYRLSLSRPVLNGFLRRPAKQDKDRSCGVSHRAGAPSPAESPLTNRRRSRPQTLDRP